MANIPKSGGNFVLNVTNTTQTYTDTLYTDNKVVSGDIEISITAKTGTASVTAQTLNSGTTTLSGTTLTVQAIVTPSVSAGYVNSGNSGVVTIKGNVPVETKTITPSASTQTITPTSGKLLSSVVVEAVPEVETETKTVKSTLATATVTPTAGKYINQVIVSPIVLEAKSVTPSASSQEVTPSSGKDGLSKVTVNAVPTETKSVKSTQATQTITPSSGKFINQVTVDPVVVQAKTVTPTTATQTISPDTGKDYLTSVKINAITVGTAGSPVATKGTVSGNKVVITPKVTNVEGYIASGTITGATIEVTAAELVSGKTTITSNANSITVTNLQYVDVAVPTGITPTGTITLTQQTGTNVTNYASANVRAASNFSLAANDNTNIVSVGTLASGYYPLTNTITATLTAATPGWFSSGQATDSSVQVGKIKAATASKTEATASATITKAASASASITITGIATTTINTGYKIEASANAGSGIAKAEVSASSCSVSEGYSDGISTSTSAKTATTTESTASDSKTVYIEAFVVTNNTSGGTSSGTIDRGKQIKMSRGYNAGDVYYTAQSNTGTTIISSAGDTNCDGYAIANVAAGSISVTSTSATTSLGVTPGAVSVANRAAAITGKTQLTVTPTTTAASVSTDYYVAVRPTAAAGSYYTLTPSTYTITADVTNAGYVDDTNDTTITINAYGRIRSNSKTGSTYYLPIPTESKTVKSTGATQTITPTSGKLIGSIIVQALTEYDGYYDIATSSN